MKKKEEKPEVEAVDYPLTEVNIQGVNFSVCIRSSVKDVRKLSNLAMGMYEYLLSLGGGYDPGVR